MDKNFSNDNLIEDTCHEKALQTEMHKDFFDRCRYAIENGFYIEAVLMEYAAIEGRLEVIMGVFGLPCNKNLPDNMRKRINISDRIECLRFLQKNNKVFENSRLPQGFFSALAKWIKKRNIYIHGLYKNGVEYKKRMDDINDVADKGYIYCKLLYNETKRLRNLFRTNEGSVFDIQCKKGGCFLQLESINASDYKEI